MVAGLRSRGQKQWRARRSRHSCLNAIEERPSALMIRLAASFVLVLAWTLAAANPPVRVRVLTYNIHHGEGRDGEFDMPRLARVITNVQPDLVGLQEVDVGTSRASGVDQLSELAQLTGMHGQFGKAMDYKG